MKQMLVMVAFAPGREAGEVAGTVVEIVVGGGNVPHKICFPERGRNTPSPKADETWLCALVRDTKPGERKGALIVRPMERATWRFIETGETCLGVVRYHAECVQVRSLSESFIDPKVRAELAQQNAAYEAALRLSEEFGKAAIDAAFVARFGVPTALRQNSAEAIHLTLAFGRGNRTVRFEDLTQLGVTATGSWRWDAETVHVEAEYQLDVNPALRFWHRVGDVGSYPQGPRHSHRLPEAMRTEICAALAAQLGTPEERATQQVESHLRGYHSAIEEFIEELGVLGSPGELMQMSASCKVDVREALSPDERRGGGWTTETVTGSWLVMCRWTAETEGWGLGDGWAVLARPKMRILSSERDLQGETAARRAKLEQLLDAGDTYVPSAELLGSVSRETWEARAKRATESVRTAKRAEIEATIAARSAALKAEYDEYHALAAQLVELRKTSAELNKRRGHACIPHLEMCQGRADLGRSDLESLRRAVAQEAAWIEAAEQHLVDTLRERGEREIAAGLEKEAATKALTEAMSAPATPARWFLSGVRTGEAEELTGRKFGEGLGERVAGRHGKWLPGDRAFAMIRIGGETVNRYSYRITVHGLRNIYGGDLPTQAGGRHASTIHATVESDDWCVIVENLEYGERKGFTVYVGGGSASIAVDSPERDTYFRSQGWDGEESPGPTEEEVRALLKLGPRPTPNAYIEDVQRGHTPPPAPEPAKPARPALKPKELKPATTAGLSALAAKFSKRR